MLALCILIGMSISNLVVMVTSITLPCVRIVGTSVSQPVHQRALLLITILAQYHKEERRVLRRMSTSLSDTCLLLGRFGGLVDRCDLKKKKYNRR